MNPIYVDQKPVQYSIKYRNVIGALQFLIGHPPFADNLTYAPIRQYNSADLRMFSEMATGDWWWSIQEQLPENATVVPLLLATDKTRLTQHHGDQLAWPVYLTIGNLDRKTRRQPNRPGIVLLGFIPIVKEKEKGD